ncbi:MAG: hypothetical protein FGF51_02615 [Candidatus Brockarchaeota archaeon]|nr:hypothetical protein [Candidatus Brockarchaeota archaeon]
MRRRYATIWGWGDRFEEVRINSEKYVSKEWRETIKECVIDFVATERSGGIGYYITAYTSNPKGVGDLAEGLFYVALNERDTKVHLIAIELFDEIRSAAIKYCNTLEEVEKTLEKHKEVLRDRFANHPEVKEVAQGRKVTVVHQITLLCELESRVANKIVIEVTYDIDFGAMKNLLHSLVNRMIERGLATRVSGYGLEAKDIGDYKLERVDDLGDEVIVWLV